MERSKKNEIQQAQIDTLKYENTKKIEKACLDT